MNKTLEKYLALAWSIESREAHGAGDLDIEHIGFINKGKRKYVLYQDSAGNYWYRTLIRTEDGYQEEEIAVFGHKIRAKKKLPPR